MFNALLYYMFGIFGIVHGIIWKTFSDIGPSSCALECHRNAGHCSGQQYDGEQFLCHLIQKADAAVSTTLPEVDMCYFTSHRYSQKLQMSCATSECGPYTACTMSSHTFTTACIETDCPAGHYRDGGDCKQCPAGTSKQSSQQRECSPCSIGHYQPLTGQYNCIKCPTGHYQPYTGYTSCFRCSAGYRQPYLGQSFCYQCGPGTFQSQTGQVSCESCHEGHYQPNNRQTACIQCPIGHYQPARGYSYCYQCTAWHYQDKTGQTSCTHCATCVNCLTYCPVQ